MAQLNLSHLLKLYHPKICVAAYFYIYIYTNSLQHTSHESLNSFFLGNCINIKVLVPHKRAIEIDFLLLAFYEQHKINNIYIKLMCAVLNMMFVEQAK